MKRGGPLQRKTRLRHGKPLQARTWLRPKRRPVTGFSAETKLAIRTRAGNGDPTQARCEATGVFLGEHGGEFQHRRARGRGGSRNPVTNSAANGVLLAGPVHALAEARDPDLHAQGFWLWSWQDPEAEPVMLHGADGGITVWLTDDGEYAYQRPEAAA